MEEIPAGPEQGSSPSHALETAERPQTARQGVPEPDDETTAADVAQGSREPVVAASDEGMPSPFEEDDEPAAAPAVQGMSRATANATNFFINFSPCAGELCMGAGGREERPALLTLKL